MRKIVFIFLYIVILSSVKAQEKPIAYFETNWDGNGPTVGLKLKVRETKSYTIKYPGSPLPDRTFDLTAGSSLIAPATHDGTGEGDIMPLIELYGDPDNLILLELSGAKVTNADVTQLILLDSLSLASNSLIRVDISKNTQLKYLNLNSNKLVELDVSTNPLLEILAIGGNQLITLDLSKQTSLKQLEAEYANLKEVKLATSSLTYLNLGLNNLKKLETGLQENLTRLKCNDMGLTEIDMSLYPNLREFNCRSNSLTSLDLSGIRFLTDVYCDNNQLTELLVVENKIYANFNCGGNNLTFHTLPLPLENWVSYAYFPQNNIQIPATASIVDLSAEYDISGEYTTYVWKTVTGKELVAGEDYVISKGITKFLKDQELPVHCELHNATFPGQESGTVKWLTTTRTNAIFDPTSIDTHESGIKIIAGNKQISIQGSNGSHLDLYDITGKLLVSKFITDENTKIEISDKGIFILQLIRNGNKITQKVIL